MKNHVKAAVAGLIIAIPWGWYTDIACGDYGLFLGRLVLTPAFAYTLSVAVSKRAASAKRQVPVRGPASDA